MEQRKDYGKTEICLLKKKDIVKEKGKYIYREKESTYDFKRLSHLSYHDEYKKTKFLN